MSRPTSAAMHKKKRKDFIPYFLGLVVFLYCIVHLISFTATTATRSSHSARIRRALGKISVIIRVNNRLRLKCLLNQCGNCMKLWVICRTEYTPNNIVVVLLYQQTIILVHFQHIVLIAYQLFLTLYREWDGMCSTAVLRVPRRFLYCPREKGWGACHILYDHFLHVSGGRYRVWWLLSTISGGHKWT